MSTIIQLGHDKKRVALVASLTTMALVVLFIIDNGESVKPAATPVATLSERQLPLPPHAERSEGNGRELVAGRHSGSRTQLEFRTRWSSNSPAPSVSVYSFSDVGRTYVLEDGICLGSSDNQGSLIITDPGLLNRIDDNSKYAALWKSRLFAFEEVDSIYFATIEDNMLHQIVFECSDPEGNPLAGARFAISPRPLPPAYAETMNLTALPAFDRPAYGILGGLTDVMGRVELRTNSADTHCFDAHCENMLQVSGPQPTFDTVRVDGPPIRLVFAKAYVVAVRAIDDQLLAYNMCWSNEKWDQNLIRPIERYRQAAERTLGPCDILQVVAGRGTAVPKARVRAFLRYAGEREIEYSATEIAKATAPELLRGGGPCDLSGAITVELRDPGGMPVTGVPYSLETEKRGIGWRYDAESGKETNVAPGRYRIRFNFCKVIESHLQPTAVEIPRGLGHTHTLVLPVSLRKVVVRLRHATDRRATFCHYFLRFHSARWGDLETLGHMWVDNATWLPTDTITVTGGAGGYDMEAYTFALTGDASNTIEWVLILRDKT